MELDLRLDALTRTLSALAHYRDRESLLVAASIARSHLEQRLEESYHFISKPLIRVQFTEEVRGELMLLVRIGVETDGNEEHLTSLSFPTLTHTNPAPDVVWMNRAYGYGSAA